MNKIKKKTERVKARYGKSITKIPKQKKKPKWKITPKGTNPLKGKVGFKASVKF